MVIWISVDEDNYVTTYSNLEQPDFIKIEIEDDFDIRTNFAFCKYDKDKESIYIDEKYKLNLIKSSKELDFRDIVSEKIIEGFKVNLNNKEYTFKCTPENVSFLEKAYSLFTNNIISETNIPMVNAQGEEELVVVVDSNIFEMWLLYYVHQEDINKHLNNVIMKQLKEAKTVEEVESIKW